MVVLLTVSADRTDKAYKMSNAAQAKALNLLHWNIKNFKCSINQHEPDFQDTVEFLFILMFLS